MAGKEPITWGPNNVHALVSRPFHNTEKSFQFKKRRYDLESAIRRSRDRRSIFNT